MNTTITTNIENTQLQLGITGELPPAPAPMGKLLEGWHDTTKHGPVFVTPGGIAWAVQLVGSKFENIAVKLSKEDIVQKPSAERIKNARRLAIWRKSRVTVTKSPILTVSVDGKANDGVSEVPKNGFLGSIC